MMSESPDRVSDVASADSSLAKNLDHAFELSDESVVIHDENMNVFVRLRPLLKEEEELGYTECITVVDSKTVHSTVPADSAKFKNLHYKPTEIFKFNQAFGSDENQYLFFENTMKDIIQTFIDGSNSLIFTYGSSGSGKTYTMQGTSSQPGILPLTVQLIFELMKDKITTNPKVKPDKYCDTLILSSNDVNAELEIKASLLRLVDHEDDSCRSDKLSQTNIFTDDVSHFSELSDISSIQSIKISTEMSLTLQNNSSYSIWVSFIEIYNEKIYDLLQPLANKKRQRLLLAEDKQGNIYVKKLREVVVENCNDVFKLLRVGRRNLKIASTKLNYQSSRSHCIFNIKVVRTSIIENVPYVKVNLLSFCDLAGSERCCKANTTGMRLKEAGNINTSLMVLGRCIETLRYNQSQKEKRIVPFRESRLTRLFSGFFTGKGKASMIVNISPSSYTFDETLHTLKFSALAKEVMMIDSTILSQLTENFAQTYNRLSMSLNDMSVDENGETDGDAIKEEYNQIVEEILEAAKKYEAENFMLKQDRREFESNLRSEISTYYEIRIQKLQDRYDKLFAYCDAQSDKRIKALMDKIAEHMENSESESDDEEPDDKMEESNSDANEKDLPQTSNTQENALQLELDEKTSAIEKLESTVAELKSKIKDQDKSMQETNVMIEKSADMLLQKEKLLGEQELELKQLKKQSSIQEKEIQSAKASLEKSSVELLTKTKQYEVKLQEMNKMQENLTHQEEKVQSLEDEMERYISVISQKNTELQKLHSNIDSMELTLKSKENLEKSLDDTRNQLNAKESEINALKKELETLKSKVQQSEEALSNAKHELSVSEDDRNKALNRIKEIELKLRDKKSLDETDIILKKKEVEIIELLEQLEKAKRELLHSKQSLEKTKDSLASSKTEYDEALKKIEQLEQSIQKKEIDFKDGLSKAAVQTETAKGNSETLLKEIEDMKQAIVSRDGQIDKLVKEQQALNQNLNGKTEEFKKLLERKDQRIDTLEKDQVAMKKQLEKDIARFKSNASEKEEQFKSLEQDSKKWSEEIKSLKIAVKEAVEAEAKAKAAIVELKKSSEAKESQIHINEQDSKETEKKLQKELNELKQSLSSKQSIIDSHLKDSKEMQGNFKKVINELKKSLELKQSTIDAQSKDSAKVVSELKIKIESLNSLLTSKESLIESQSKDHEHSIEKLKNEIEELKNSLVAKQQVIDAQSKIDELKSKLKEVADASCQVEIPSAVLEEELKVSQERIKNLEKNEVEMKRMLGERTDSIQDLETALIDLQSPLKRNIRGKQQAKITEMKKLEEKEQGPITPSRLSRLKTSRLVAAATASVLSPIKKVAEVTSSLIPTPSKKNEVNANLARRTKVAVSKTEVAKPPAIAVIKAEVAKPPAIVKKLRSRITKVSYVDSPDVISKGKKRAGQEPIAEEEVVEPPRKKKAPEKKTTEDTTKAQTQRKNSRLKKTSNVTEVQRRSSRQRGGKVDPPKNPPQVSSSLGQTNEKNLPSTSTVPTKPNARKNVKTAVFPENKRNEKAIIANALAFLDPHATSTPVQLEPRRKKRIYGPEQQPMVLSPIPAAKPKSPATAQKSAKEITRQINTRRQRR